ncbi:MAG: hypothetical protein CL985_00250 [Euryarchaeota archaeon]|nr:hypothetical protein [Euryarchaeota archaeon]|tara:strand:+ start:133 stop:387 length:255 start_codon:yes stop_codon:yes gene_type:complete
MKTKIKMVILRWALRLTLKDEHREAILIHELNHVCLDRYGVSLSKYLMMTRISQDFMFNDAVTSHDPDPYDEHGVNTKNSFNTP